jgi:hypothetical protein
MQFMYNKKNLCLNINVIDGWLVWLMVFNATFNNISAVSWWSVLLLEETGGPGEKHRHVASNWQTVSQKVVSSTLPLSGVSIQNVNAAMHRLHS